MVKDKISDLAMFGGIKLFHNPISTSNLVKPSFDKFLEYSTIFYEKKRYTNDGPLVKELERRLSKFHNVSYCMAYVNGFWALVASIKSLALSGREEVLMPSLTYRRLADVVAWCGLKPRFCEVDERTLSIDPQDMLNNISIDTALILAAHPIVNTCDATKLQEIADHRKIPILFDSVESVYETVDGRKVGSFGNAECFSMHASKLINAFEGGYITTNDPALAYRLSIMRGFGFYGPDNVEVLGFNAKLNEIHAAMALASLDDLENQVVRNKQKYRQYQNLLKDIDGVRLIEFNEGEKTSFKNILIKLEDSWPLDREITVELLNAEGALVRPYYYPALHTKEMDYPHVSATLPITESLSLNHMLLPCGHHVSDVDIDKFVSLLQFIKNNAEKIKLLKK
jgi:dTDP-4-amino-4,6-dideoxygalactose transaminase